MHPTLDPSDDLFDMAEIPTHLRPRRFELPQHHSPGKTRLLSLGDSRAAAGYEPPPKNEPGQSAEISAGPLLLFRPIGLWLFGFTDETYVTDLIIGAESQLIAGGGPIRGEVFGSPYTFSQLAEAIELSEEQVGEMQRTNPDLEAFVRRLLTGLPRLRYENKRVVSAFHQLDCQTATPGQLVRLRYTGPLTDALVLGKTAQ